MEDKKEIPTLGEDLKEIVVSFGTAAKTAISTLLFIPGEEEKEEDKSALNQAIKAGFTPLSSYAFMAFVLLYMPCRIVLAAMPAPSKTQPATGIHPPAATPVARRVAAVWTTFPPS